LVIPVDSFGDVTNGPKPMAIGTQMPGGVQPGGPSPIVAPNGLTGGMPIGAPMGSNSQTGPLTPGNGAWTKSRPVTQEESLIKLISNTISPNSWKELGGQGTIDYFPATMTLVVNQTLDLQEQIADLLAALRRLQDQEVSIEIRFITITEDFFERIGLDFNLNIVNPTNTNKYQPLLTNGTFTPAPFINAFNPKDFLTGLTPAGTFTPDLNIPIKTSSFTETIPQLGGYTGAGGLAIGLAFLSDIQVFLFLEAVQGDTRANIMQAPKLTLYNGQTATLTVTDTQTFVTNISLTGLANGNFAFAPTVTALPTGAFVTMQAVISGDRRFVRMSLTPTLTNFAPGPVNLFPVVVPIFPNVGITEPSNPILFTQFLQLPSITSVSVSTTVAVPDGGTVIMGGMKRLSEARSEYGPPILSKIPYLSRLFKNTGYGRDTESLLIMVTPRIIIQEEEEERATGYRTPPAIQP
jgi:type II secretory pathway component GspD/PulD (secretin)